MTDIRTDFDSASDFLDHLQVLALGASYGATYPSIFRGVGNVEEHKLVPTALRESGVQRLIELATIEVEGAGEEANRLREVNVLHEFNYIANRSGLSVSELNTKAIDKTLSEVLKSSHTGPLVTSCEWPPKELLEVAALGQHYGLPTRLLDWTHNFHTAAFFACRHVRNEIVKSAVHVGQAPGQDPIILTEEQLECRLGVWHLDLLSAANSDHLETVKPPYAGNPNLFAQQGILTHWRTLKGVKKDEPLDDTPLEGHINSWNANSSKKIRIRLVTLPWRQVRELIEMLEARGVHTSRLFPGYQGVASTVEDNSHNKCLKQIGLQGAWKEKPS